jgi:threonine aldolase
MRQVGVVAAAGIISLERMVNRLAEDHLRAKKLADGLRHVKGLIVDQGSPYTNMVYLNLAQETGVDSRQVKERMGKAGVLVDAENSQRFRLVTHYEIDDKAVETTISAFVHALR